MDKNHEKLLMSKLRMPVHIDYIAKYILKTNILETREILSQFVEEGVIQESSLAKDYYTITPKNSK